MEADWTEKYQVGTLLQWGSFPPGYDGLWCYYLVLTVPVKRSHISAVFHVLDIANRRTIITTCGKNDKMWKIVQVCDDSTDG